MNDPSRNHRFAAADRVACIGRIDTCRACQHFTVNFAARPHNLVRNNAPMSSLVRRPEYRRTLPAFRQSDWATAVPAEGTTGPCWFRGTVPFGAAKPPISRREYATYLREASHGRIESVHRT